MLELTLLTAGVVIGCTVAWLVTRSHCATLAVKEREGLHLRMAAAEALAAELGKQVDRRGIEIGELRGELDGERQRRAEAEARWEAARAGFVEQQRHLDEARVRLAETFKALSAEALQQSSTAFLERAREALESQLERRREAIDGVVKPLHDALRRFEDQAQAVEAARQRAYGSLEQQLQSLAAINADLQRETGALVTALRAPHVRGRWGEITLHRVVELAGMTEHCDYLEQVTVEGESGRLRPDMVVRLPAKREIVVDAKVPLSAYLDATVAPTPAERTAALLRHAQQMRQHMAGLAGKAYWEEFAGAADLVVMFVPGESFVAAAVEADPSLIEDAMARRVVVATPTTLIALLRAIAYGWRQEQLATNAAQISELGRQLYERLRSLASHFEELGTSLGRATAAFNRAVGSMETRVLPAARRFRDLGAATEELPVLDVIDQQPRSVSAPDLSPRLYPSDLPA
jgi:DNA recombination protein RmuC